ncbi:hypothetical protein NLX83_38495 [Allokutzneria sp. A3M-2-11 16]|uniref:hypothetical protein n=1 Tax=Allokutzneria sp. A3M-2-11 16 TaxID=2962043 RepID=UPI0020B649F1|nr:hypothetical protein [Allokutzneria sp. A3M-2-11 16]MCP3805170.1 hypothetical protein [Allokutzneria sp. A3M-2-11 16]
MRERGSGDKGVLVAQGKDEIAALAHLLEVDDTAEAFLCMCWGDLEFVVHGPSTETLVLHLDGSLASRQGDQLPLVRSAELVQWLISRRFLSPTGSPLARAFWGLAPNVDFALSGPDLTQIAGRFARAYWSVRSVSPTSYEITGEWAHLAVSSRDNDYVLSGVAVPEKLPRLREVLVELNLLPS